MLSDESDHSEALVVGAARRVGVAAGLTVGALIYPRRLLVGVVDAGREAWERASAEQAAWRARWVNRWRRRRRTRAGARQRVNADAVRVAAGEGLDAVARTLADPDPSVRILALEVICEFSEDRAARLLVGVLHDPHPQVRAAAAAAAGRVGASTLVFSLILALEDTDDEVRQVAARSLEKITGKTLELAPAGDRMAVAKQIAELKRWWKEKRLGELVEEARAKGTKPR